VVNKKDLSAERGIILKTVHIGDNIKRLQITVSKIADWLAKNRIDQEGRWNELQVGRKICSA
jgi:hypothetical protein